MNSKLIEQILQLKKKFESDGFIIEGVFGSYVRGENKPDSDIDLLIELNDEFKDKYKGFIAIRRLDEISRFISEYLQIEADLVQKSTLNPIARKYILSEMAYV
jgi:hypothetical protein